MCFQPLKRNRPPLLARMPLRTEAQLSLTKNLVDFMNGLRMLTSYCKRLTLILRRPRLRQPGWRLRALSSLPISARRNASSASSRVLNFWKMAHETLCTWDRAPSLSAVSSLDGMIKYNIEWNDPNQRTIANIFQDKFHGKWHSTGSDIHEVFGP